jgi:hypothetical protein
MNSQNIIADPWFDLDNNSDNYNLELVADYIAQEEQLLSEIEELKQKELSYIKRIKIQDDKLSKTHVVWDLFIGEESHTSLKERLNKIIIHVIKVKVSKCKRCELLKEIELIWKAHPLDKPLYNNAQQKLVVLNIISQILQDLKHQQLVFNKGQRWSLGSSCIHVYH